VEFHRFNRRDRGRTLLRTAVPFRPSNPRDGRSVMGDGSCGDVGYGGNVGNAGTELNVSTSRSKEGERGLSRL
jgi:hypothetical protein